MIVRYYIVCSSFVQAVITLFEHVVEYVVSGTLGSFYFCKRFYTSTTYPGTAHQIWIYSVITNETAIERNKRSLCSGCFANIGIKVLLHMNRLIIFIVYRYI